MNKPIIADVKNIDAYENIKSEITHKKSITALERVKEAIDFFKAEKVDFSVAGIARFCVNKHGSPKAQSIRNSPQLMRLFNYEKSIYKIKNKSYDNSILDTISDERVKAHIIVQDEEIKALKKKYNDLKTVLANIQPIDVDELIRSSFDPNHTSEPSNLLPENSQGKKLIPVEGKVNKLVVKDMIDSEQVENMIEVLNSKLLNNIDVILKFENGMLINENTSSILFEFGLKNG